MTEEGGSHGLGQQPGCSTDIFLDISNAMYSIIESADGSVTLRLNCGTCLTESTEILLNSNVHVDTSNNRAQKTETALNSLSLDSNNKSRGNFSCKQTEKDFCAKSRNEIERGQGEADTDSKDVDKNKTVLDAPGQILTNELADSMDSENDNLGNINGEITSNNSENVPIADSEIDDDGEFYFNAEDLEAIEIDETISIPSRKKSENNCCYL